MCIYQMESESQFKELLKSYNYKMFKYDDYIDRYRCFKDLIEKKITNKEAAKRLRLSKSQIKKIKQRIMKEGYKGLIHRLKGVGRNKKFAVEQITLIVSLYNGTYAMETGEGKYDFSEANYSHFHRHLTNEDGDAYEFGIKISLSHLRNILNQHGFVSVASKKFKETHNHKGRRLGIKYLPGERWETDGTFFDWFDTGETRCIHVVYDRGLEAPIAMFMSEGETTIGYYGAFKRALMNYGLPKLLIGDRRTTFYNVTTDKAEKKYDTKFNNLMDELGIKYDYTSNSNGKPAVEAFNKDLKTNLTNDFKRHNIKTMEEANEYLHKYVQFKQKEKNMKKENKHGRKVNENEFEDKAIIERKEIQTKDKGRIYISGIEYEVFRDGKLIQMPKGTKVKYVEVINRNKYIYVGKQRYELKVSIEVEKKEYEKIAVKEKVLKVKSDMSILYGGNNYVILQNNGKHLEIDEYEKVLLQVKENEMKAHYKGKAYKVIPKGEYVFEYKIKARKECSVKFHCLVNYDKEEYVLLELDDNKKIAYQPDGVNKLLVKYDIDGLYAFKEDKKVYRLVPSSESKLNIPNSNLQAKRYRDHQ